MSPAGNARTAVLHQVEEADAVRRGLCAQLIVVIDELKDRSAESPTFAKNKSARVGQPFDKLNN